MGAFPNTQYTHTLCKYVVGTLLVKHYISAILGLDETELEQGNNQNILFPLPNM